MTTGFEPITMQEQLVSVTMTTEDIDRHISFILSRQKNHKPPTTEIVDFWLDQRLEVMQKEKGRQ